MPGTTAQLRGYLHIFPEGEPGRSALAPPFVENVLRSPALWQWFGVWGCLIPPEVLGHGVWRLPVRGLAHPWVGQRGSPMGRVRGGLFFTRMGAHYLPAARWGVLGTVFPDKEA